MKIGLFSDPHYCDAGDIGGGRKPLLSYNKVKEAMEYFKTNGADMCFCLGDLTDSKEGDTKTDAQNYLRCILKLIRSYNIPFYLVVGNHDYLLLNAEDIEAEGLRVPPYTVQTEECKFIILDANYRSNMERFDKAGVVWDDSNLPPFQVEFLKNELKNSPTPCIVMVHENLDPTVHVGHIIKNADEVRQVISSSDNVKMVIQGHYHGGNKIEIDNIPYIILKAMCENDKDIYSIIEI